MEMPKWNLQCFFSRTAVEFCYFLWLYMQVVYDELIRM